MRDLGWEQRTYLLIAGGLLVALGALTTLIKALFGSPDSTALMIGGCVLAGLIGAGSVGLAIYLSRNPHA